MSKQEETSENDWEDLKKPKKLSRYKTFYGIVAIENISQGIQWRTVEEPELGSGLLCFLDVKAKSYLCPTSLSLESKEERLPQGILEIPPVILSILLSKAFLYL